MTEPLTRPNPWTRAAREAGIPVLTDSLRQGCRLLRDLGTSYGITKSQRRTFLMLFAAVPSHVDALETVLALTDAETAQSRARAGIAWLDAMLTEYHAVHLRHHLRRLTAMSLDPMQIAEALNDAGMDDLFNGHQPIGEWHVRRACKRLGLKVRPVRWRA